MLPLNAAISPALLQHRQCCLSASDNCDPSLTAVKTAGDFIADTCANSGSYTNTFSVTDDCGNISIEFTQIIHIADRTNPIITCPINIGIDCDESIDPTNTGTATATDNCDSAPLIEYADDTIAGGECLQAFTIERTWTATDACGNSSSCVQLISLQDISPPVLIGVPGDTIVSCDEIPLPPTVTATDNCDPTVTVTFTEINDVLNGCGSYYPHLELCRRLQ